MRKVRFPLKFVLLCILFTQLSANAWAKHRQTVSMTLDLSDISFDLFSDDPYGYEFDMASLTGTYDLELIYNSRERMRNCESPDEISISNFDLDPYDASITLDWDSDGSFTGELTDVSFDITGSNIAVTSDSFDLSGLSASINEGTGDESGTGLGSSMDRSINYANDNKDFTLDGTGYISVFEEFRVDENNNHRTTCRVYLDFDWSEEVSLWDAPTYVETDFNWWAYFYAEGTFTD